MARVSLRSGRVGKIVRAPCPRGPGRATILPTLPILLDHLVGARHDRNRKLNAEYFRSFQVDGQ